MSTENAITEVWIEKAVPVPGEGERGGRTGATDILRRLEVGDSVVIPGLMVASWRQLARRLGMRVRVRSVGGGEARFWRIG